jgi:hypothetical protein
MTSTSLFIMSVQPCDLSVVALLEGMKAQLRILSGSLDDRTGSETTKTRL